MAGGFAASTGSTKKYAGRVTAFVVVACLVSATGGLIFGYDLGISGGVTSMDPFLKKFFPNVFRKQKLAHTNAYCKFDDQLLTTFTSSLYIAGLIASIFASTSTRLLGRKTSMLFGGLLFLIGAALNGAAANVAMLILGRICLGIGIGFANQAVPVYLSEMAPPRHRGTLNIFYQMFLLVGYIMAALINFCTQKLDGWGWRLSLGLAAVPAGIMTIGSVGLPETPNSLLERGHHEKARAMLEKIRGTPDVQEEFQDLIEASEVSRSVKHPFRTILERRYRPHLVMALTIFFFQQLTGINVITFYAPVLFKTLGLGTNAALFSTFLIGIVGGVGVLVALFTVDKVGRRFLFITGGIVMLVCQVAIAVILAINFGNSGEGSLSKGFSIVMVLLICIYVIAFDWSWGPVAVLVPSEIFPLEIRSAGQSITVTVGLFFTFVIAQGFLAMLCHMKYWLFIFFGGGVAVMTAFVYWLLPETKNVPIEEMGIVWKQHWYWKRFVEDNGPTKIPAAEKAP